MTEKRPRGRPPGIPHPERLTARLCVGTLARIRAAAGKMSESEFIRRAIESALRAGEETPDAI